jgi:hypothetical protein
MKYMKKIFLFIGLLTGLVSFGQNGDADAIVNSLKSGDAMRLTDHLDEFVDVKLLDKAEVKNMSRNQAALTLKSFFTENGINGFEKTSQRDVSGISYLTGKLQNSNKGYNITVMMKMKNGKWQIITLRVS